MKRGTDAFKKYGAMVRGVVEFLKGEDFAGNVVYVTSPPGFPNCDKGRWRPNDSPPVVGGNNVDFFLLKPAFNSFCFHYLYKYTVSSLRLKKKEKREKKKNTRSTTYTL